MRAAAGFLPASHSGRLFFQLATAGGCSGKIWGRGACSPLASGKHEGGRKYCFLMITHYRIWNFELRNYCKLGMVLSTTRPDLHLLIPKILKDLKKITDSSIHYFAAFFHVKSEYQSPGPWVRSGGCELWEGSGSRLPEWLSLMRSEIEWWG